MGPKIPTVVIFMCVCLSSGPVVSADRSCRDIDDQGAFSVWFPIQPHIVLPLLRTWDTAQKNFEVTKPEATSISIFIASDGGIEVLIKVKPRGLSRLHADD